MEYAELFERALKGRSVNQASKDWGLPQGTLARYAKGDRIPDYQTAMTLSLEARVDAGEVMAIMARQEARKKPRSLFPDMGYMDKLSANFEYLVSLVRPRRNWFLAR